MHNRQESAAESMRRHRAAKSLLGFIVAGIALALVASIGMAVVAARGMQ